MFKKLISSILIITHFVTFCIPREALALIVTPPSGGGMIMSSLSVGENINGVISGGGMVLTSGTVATFVDDGEGITYESSAPDVKLSSGFGRTFAGVSSSQFTRVHAGLEAAMAPMPPVQRDGMYLTNQVAHTTQRPIQAFDLDDYFMSLTGQKLTYQAVGNTDTTINIDSSNVVTITWEENYTGQEEVYFTVTDQQGARITSNTFTVYVVDQWAEDPLFEALESYINDIEYVPDEPVIIEVETENENLQRATFSFTAVLDKLGNWHIDYLNGEAFDLYKLEQILSTQLNFRFNFFIPESQLAQYAAGGTHQGLFSSNHSGGGTHSNDDYVIESEAVAEPFAGDTSNAEYTISAGIVQIFAYREAADSRPLESHNAISQQNDFVGQACGGIVSNISYNVKSGLGYTQSALYPVQLSGQILPDQTIVDHPTTTKALFDLDDYFISPLGLDLVYQVLDADLIDMTVDASGMLTASWADGWQGSEQFILLVTDTQGRSIKSNTFTVTVQTPANPPVMDFIPDIEASEGDLIVIIPRSVDIDGDLVTYSYSGLFDHFGIWQTDYESAGEYTVTVTATDRSGLTDTQNIHLKIANANRAPVFDENTVYTINAAEGETLYLRPQVTDPDGSAITMGYSYGFDATGRWIIGYDQAGTHYVDVTASDGLDPTVETFTINVDNTNRAPVVELTLDTYTAQPNDTIQAAITAYDPDADSMTWQLLDKDNNILASGTYTSQITQNISFTSEADQTITAIVTDNDSLDPRSGEDSKALDIVDPSVNDDDINALMGDFNGDGVLDLGIHDKSTGAWDISLSDHGEFYGARRWITGHGSSSDWAPNCGDFNGDGKSDAGIYNRVTGELKAAYSNGSQFGNTTQIIDVSYADANWILSTSNFNGDKYGDIALYNYSTGEVRVHLGNGSGFDAYTTWITGAGSGYMPMSGDFNGDGLSDLGLYKSGTADFKVAFSNGSEFVDISSWTTGFAADAQLQLSDFNGDGMVDIGEWNESDTWYYSISNGSEFVNRHSTWISDFGSSSYEFASTGDFNGDGITDAALFDRQRDGIKRWELNIREDVKADLLVEVLNNTGGKTEIEYTYSTQMNNPELPFPVYVTARTTSVDMVGSVDESYSMEFDYSDGYFDTEEKEFRGFGKVKTLDPISGNYTALYYDLGQTDGAMKGQILKIAAYDGNGKQISEVINEYDVKTAGPVDGLGFPALVGQKTMVWEVNLSSLCTRNEFEYDAIGNVLVTDMYGEYDGQNDTDITGDERKLITTFASPYEAGFNRTTRTQLKDHNDVVVSQTDFAYDVQGRLVAETSWLDGSSTQPSVSYTYDIYGNVLTVTDPLNHTMTTGYDSQYHAYPVSVTNQLNQVSTTTYDVRFGNELSVTDPNGATVSKSYDSIGRLLQEFNTDNIAVVTHAYPNWNTKTVTSAGITKTECLDGLGRVYQTVSTGEDGDFARNVSTEVVFNDRGQVVSETLPHYIDADPSTFAYKKYEYDLRGRVVRTIADFAGTTEDYYSTIDYVEPLYSEAMDPKGHKKGIRKDVYGNVVESVDLTTAGAYVTSYEYDANDKLVKLTDTEGNIQIIEYDTLGRKISMDDPDMGQWHYHYDIAGRLIEQIDAKGQILEFEYDVLNRLVKKSFVNGHLSSVLTENFYDDALHNRIGRLWKVEDTTGSTVFYFDQMGRKVRSDKTVDSHIYTVYREYDIYDRLTSVTYPDGEEIEYGYDIHSGALESVIGDQTYVANMRYDGSGRLLRKDYGNGTYTNYTYGYDYRLSNIKTKNASNATLQDLSYDFDANGNIIELVNNLVSNIREFEYDELDRLTQASNIETDSGFTTMNYSYDPIGNMTYKSDVGFMTYGTNAGPHAVTSAGGYTFTYDANGNMLTNRGKIMSYDAENQLISVEKGAVTTTFAYDGAGGRVKKTATDGVDTEETTYIGKLYEIDQDGNTKKHIFAGSDRAVTIESTGEYEYYHSDHLGSSNVITNQNGVKVSGYEYKPYGSVSKQTGTDTVNHKFTGQEFDKETDLHYYNARYYDSWLGRFTQADTIIQDPLDSQSLNRYSYCRNNPLKYTDPSGHIFGLIIYAIVAIVKAAVVGAVVGAVVSGAYAACTGGDIGRAMVSGAIGGACTGAFGAILGGGLIGGMLSGAAGNAASAGIQGGDVGRAALSGAVGGLVSGTLSAYTPSASGTSIGSKVINICRNSLISSVAGGAASSSVGGSFKDGAKEGSITGAISAAFAPTVARAANAAMDAAGGFIKSVFAARASPGTVSGASTMVDPGKTVNLQDDSNVPYVSLGEIVVEGSSLNKILWPQVFRGAARVIGGVASYAVLLRVAPAAKSSMMMVYRLSTVVSLTSIIAYGLAEFSAGLAGERVAPLEDVVKEIPAQFQHVTYI